MQRQFAFIAFLALATFANSSGRADDVPFAQPTPSPSSQLETSQQKSLGEIMATIQSRHAKLFYAANAGNWPLAAYELDQVRDSFIASAYLYQNLPVDLLALVTRPIDDMNAAVRKKDGQGFARGFANLTKGCNACHGAGQVGFIVIKTPTASTFSNQNFEPQRK